MAARITGELGGAVGGATDTANQSEGAITLEGDNITVNAPSAGAQGQVITQSPKNFIPILLVIALVVVIWYYLKKKGQA